MNRRQRQVRLFSLLFLGVLLTGCNFPPFKANKLFQSLSQTPTTAAAVPLTPVLTPEGEAQAGSNDCLVGRWQLTNGSTLASALMPADLVQEYQLTTGASRGDFIYTFTPEGQVDIVADNFETDITGSLAGINVDGVAVLNGSAAGNYAPGSTGGTVAFSNLVNSGFTASVKVGPLTVVPETAAGANIGLGSSTGSAELAYTCSANDLSIDVPANDQTPALTMTFTRINP